MKKLALLVGAVALVACTHERTDNGTTMNEPAGAATGTNSMSMPARDMNQQAYPGTSDLNQQRGSGSASNSSLQGGSSSSTGISSGNSTGNGTSSRSSGYSTGNP
ncbi:MAG: hypothetical protein ACXWBP_03395 [Limisphaerales bacterium]